MLKAAAEYHDMYHTALPYFQALGCLVIVAFVLSITAHVFFATSLAYRSRSDTQEAWVGRIGLPIAAVGPFVFFAALIAWFVMNSWMQSVN